MKTTSHQQLADETIETFYPHMVEVRRHMHVHPEPSGSEYETTQFLAEELRRLGTRVRLGHDDRGVIADSPRDYKRLIVVRADIDALHIQDAKQVDYASSVPNVMHACAHDAHSATILGVVRALRALEDAGAFGDDRGWRAIFQTAEETNKGAREMIAAGALEGAEAALSLHMDPSRPVGTIAVREGALTAICDEMYIDIQGRGGHAARPHESLDPIAAAAHLISTVYQFVPRQTDSHEAVVVSFGHINGGDNANVIPQSVTLRGTIRTLSETVRRRTKDHIFQLARGLAEASATEMKVEFVDGPPAVYNDGEMNDLVCRAADDIPECQQIDEIARPSMGGEDFAHYLKHVPGCMFRVGCSAAAIGCTPLHSPSFDVDERAMRVAAKIITRAVCNWATRD
ncbi:MAG: amidohydrolase [Planctomycetales bacterium]|nr:amidohydrolase [Planctomycetales bacterium]